VLALPGYTPDSGDEWGNTLAPLRLLLEGGNPGTFFHPSLYYYVTAAAYVAVYWGAQAVGAVDGGLTLTDLFVREPRYFVFTARAVSVSAGAAAMWALYAFGRHLWNRHAGLLAAALLAMLPLHAVYSEAVRVDSLFLALFIATAHQIVRLAQGAAVHDRAAILLGLTTGANYNGAILAPWLVAALLWRGGGWRPLSRALALGAAVFLASSPFLLLDLPTARKYVGFILGLSTAAHVGMEGRGLLFYAQDLARATPLLAAVIAAAIAAIGVLGTRAERFALSVPVGYFLLFSALGTKFDRLILPALALFLLMASGLPVVLARRLRAPLAAGVATAGSWALLVACLASLAPLAIPVPHHPMLARPDGVLLDWIERHARPSATILVEAGAVQLIDVLTAEGRFPAAVRGALRALRPGLDHTYLAAIYVGEQQHYSPALLREGRLDYALVSMRTMRDIERRCATFPDVCAFYAELRRRGRIAFETPTGVEPAVIYALRAANR